MDYENILKEQFENVIDQDTFQGIYDNAYDITGGLSKQFTLENILNATLQGESFFQSGILIDGLKSLLLYEVKAALLISVEILSICIIAGLLSSLSEGFGSKNISRLGMMVCTIAIAGAAVSSFKISYQLALDAVSAMTYTMELMLPVLIGILLATGSVTSGTILSPLMIGAVTGFSAVIKNVILPAFYLSVILSTINCLTEKNYVNKLSKLIRSAAVFVTGLILTVLSGIMTLQGLLTETSDGLLINAAKYSLSSFIPIVGGFTSDTAELFIRCMGSIKSVVGVFGLVVLILMMAVPLLKIIVIGGIYKLTSALIEPVTDLKIADGLNDMGNTVISIGSVLFFTSLLFIIFLSIIMKIGGTA